MIVVEESNGITAGVQSKKDAVELLVQELNTSLKSPTVITPDSEGYAESIRRWSDAVEKRAVREPKILKHCLMKLKTIS